MPGLVAGHVYFWRCRSSSRRVNEFTDDALEEATLDLAW
jgi:hypothetical protein